jgi:hypothetical protein
MRDKYLLRWKIRDTLRSAKHFFGWSLLILFFMSITWLLDYLLSNLSAK